MRGAVAAVLACAVVVLSGCTDTAKLIRGGGPTIAQAQAEAVDGPKFRIAVGSIIDKTGDAGARSLAQQVKLINGGRDSAEQIRPEAVTQGIRDMLVTELFNSGQFIVLDREDLDAAMVEQAFSQSSKVGDGTRIPLGQLEGADLLVVGALTAFDSGAGSEGGAIPIPIPLGRDYKYGAGILSLSYKRGYVAMDLRVIDVATGRIVAATAVEGSNYKYGINLEGLLGSDYGYVRLPQVLGFFSNTPVEQALQKMVSAAVAKIAEQHPLRPQAAQQKSPGIVPGPQVLPAAQAPL